MLCRIDGCGNRVPSPLQGELLCPDHFFQQAFDLARWALDNCQQGRALDAAPIDWLFSSAAYAANQLLLDAGSLSDNQRDDALQLMLCLTNLLEYMRHHSVALDPPDLRRVSSPASRPGPTRQLP
jgi:hypothetical protein